MIREWVRETSRWRNARAARGYRERRVATAEDDDGLEGAMREITEGAVVVVVAVGMLPWCGYATQARGSGAVWTKVCKQCGGQARCSSGGEPRSRQLAPACSGVSHAFPAPAKAIPDAALPPLAIVHY